VQLAVITALALAAAGIACGRAPVPFVRRVGAPALGLAFAVFAVAAALTFARLAGADAPVESLRRAVCDRADHPGGPAARAAIDAITTADGAPLPPQGVPRGGAVRVQGWMAGDGRGAVPCILVDERIAADQVADYGATRHDVAAALSAPAAERSGFVAQLATDQLAPGPHQVRVAAVMPDGSYRAASAAQTLTIAR
jgi:hypothetical protein